MKKKKSKLKKLLLVVTIFIMNGLGFMNAVYAATLSSAHIYSVGDCGELLKYKGVVVQTYYVEYNNDGIGHPAYCLDKNKHGVGADLDYGVSIQEAITDVGLWRRIINGYPYKSIEELGVANKEEAFTATKQAIYCYIHGNNPNDYEPIGEAGVRTLNALNKIVNDANNSKESKVSSTIGINKLGDEWIQDKENKQYASKIFEVKANSNLENYTIKLTKEDGQEVEGIKITDLQNNEKNQFAANEKFKILIPIKSMNKKGFFKIEVEGKVETKPVLYGAAPNGEWQDYALTAATYEEGTGKKEEEYPENETRIIIIKEDEKTKEKLENTEFELLDENKNIVYSDLKTDKEGKIEIKHLIPGKYYLRETKAKEGYEKYEELIELEVAWQEQYTITVNNNKQEKPKIEVDKKQKNKEITTRKILPVTGM